MLNVVFTLVTLGFRSLHANDGGCGPVCVVQELTAYTDRSFTFKLSTPQTTWMLKRCAGIEKVSLAPSAPPAHD